MNAAAVESPGGASLWTPRFAAILASQMAFGFAFSTFFLFPKFLASELGAGPAEIGWVTAVSGFSTVASMFAMGSLVDRYGRKRFLRAGAVLMVAASLALTGIDELNASVYVLRALQGAAFAMAFVSGATLAVDEAPADRLSQAIGIFGLSMLSMNAVAPMLAEAIADRAGWGWDWVFRAAAVGAALCLALSGRIRERPRPTLPREQRVGLLAVARRPEQIRVAVVIAVVGGAFGAVFTFHQPFALKLGIDRLQSFFIAYAIAAMAARLGLGHFADRLGRRATSLLSLALYAVAVASVSQLRPGALAPIGGLFGFAHGIFYPAFNGLAVQGANANERGKLMALFQGWFNLGLAGFAIPLGRLAEVAGYPPVFIAAAAATAGAFLVLAFSRELGRDEVPVWERTS